MDVTDNFMSSDESDVETDTQGWCTSLRNFPLVPPFTGTPGFNFDLDDEVSPIDFFDLYFLTMACL